MSKLDLVKYIPMRKELCKMAKKGKLDTLTEFKEIKIFLRLYNNLGSRCNYLLSVCHVIDTMPSLKSKIHELK
jgi:hypothetical protein